MVGDRAGAGQAEPDPAGQPGAGGAVDGGVGDGDAEAEQAGVAGPVGGLDRWSVSSGPTGTPATTSCSRTPKLVSSSTATVCPSAVTRDDVPMPPLKPRQDMPVPAPTAPSSGASPDPREASAASRAARTSSAVTCIRRQSLRCESSHSPTTGITTSSATSACSSSSISQAASYTRPSCMVEVR